MSDEVDFMGRFDEISLTFEVVFPEINVVTTIVSLISKFLG